MRRRGFITLLGGAAAWPLTAHAQQSPMPVIGYLTIRPSSAEAGFLVFFRKGLFESGFIEGQNVAIEYRYAEGQFDRLPQLAVDLVRHRVAVIVATGGVQAALAAKAVTKDVPIVFTTAGDPVEEGLVQSLHHPGGNLTGVTTSFGEAAPKRLGLLREIVPTTKGIGVLVNPRDPITSKTEANNMRAAAASVGVHIEILQATNEHEIETVFVSLANLGLDALLIQPDALFVTQGNQLLNLAARDNIPTLYWRREFVEAGGLMSYGSSLGDALHVVGLYTGRALKGENPGDLPVQQPTKFAWVINLKTAKALNLSISPMLLTRADEVIE